MKPSGQKSLPAIGFLTVTRDAEHGLFGGYLVLNHLGRPMEFHCTAPVRPNRAQEILYGPTLEPYLYGERIGQTLLRKSSLSPVLAVTDVEPVMAARAFVSVPLALVARRPALAEAGSAELADVGSPTLLGQRLRRDPPHPAPRASRIRLTSLDACGGCLAVAADYPGDVECVRRCWPLFAEQIDLEEPFGRIRDAIEEARNGVR